MTNDQKGVKYYEIGYFSLNIENEACLRWRGQAETRRFVPCTHPNADELNRIHVAENVAWWQSVEVRPN